MGPADATATQQRNDAMKTDDRLRMLIDAPGVNHWREVDGGVRGILELYAYYRRLARREAGNAWHRQVRRSGQVLCGVHQRHISWDAKANNLEWAVDRTAANIFDGNGSVEGLIYPAVGQARSRRGNLTRWYD